MSKEIFKDIPGYEGMYQVSNLGNVKSFKRGYLLKNNLNNRYLKVKLKRKTIMVHQLVAMSFLNHIPNGNNIIVDHIDCNKLNNKLCNLQLITNRENLSKDKKNKTSKYTGVCWHKRSGKWRSKICINRKHKHLGYFDCELKAAEVYQDELKLLSCK